MCIYCTPNDKIDIMCREIFNIRVDCGFVGKICSSLSIRRKEKVLEMVVYNEKGDDYRVKKAIEKCPFCGEFF